ncbi:MAG: hybrid sensor histidine kinase/response regulator [Gemmatimonadota bacterium]
MVTRPQDCTIVLIDDEEANLDLLEAILREDGYVSLARTSRPQEAERIIRRESPDLILLDLHMPPPDGFAILESLRASTPGDEYLPVLVLTADAAPAARERALSGGARDFLTKPFDVTEVLLRVRNLLEARLLHRLQREARSRAEALAAENARLFAEAQQATRARERLLSVVAHDLRNPLSIVAMHAEMLEELRPPETTGYLREALESISAATGRMQLLIEDLLDVSRLEHGTFKLALAETTATELLAEADRALRPLAEANGIAIEFRTLGQADPLQADGARLLQALSNLVSNAVKFTPPGGRVRVSAATDSSGLKMAVTDSGPGIPPDQIPHVFTAFWQSGDSERRGVGLGLWIVRSIVEAHGGRIWVESSPGDGSTFRFEIPTVSAREPIADGSGGAPSATRPAEPAPRPPMPEMPSPTPPGG